MTNKSHDETIKEEIEEHQKRFLEKVGENIRTTRLSHETSQKALAERAGLQPTYLNDVEKGRRNLSMHSFLAISRALDVAPVKLLHKTDRKILFENE